MILVVNAGSSSIKYQVIDPSSELTTASGVLERIGEPSSLLRHTTNGQTTEHQLVTPDRDAAFNQILSAFGEFGPDLASSSITAVGHRIVMGGMESVDPALITEEVIDAIDRLSPLAPLHNPANLAAVLSARKAFAEVPHVAVFDTAFFHHLPAVASTYAIDSEISQRYQIRRYGFHGISHEYVSGITSEMVGQDRGHHDGIRQVVLHLGNGASASAIVDGEPVDTSMGFTPLEGLVMGTRSGDIDPSVAFYLHRERGMSVEQVDQMLNRQSGLQGLCGHNDMRDIHRLIADGDRAAQLAFDIYVRRIQKYIGSYAAVMGGIDAVTFTAGVGENDAILRAATIEPLGFMGMRVDPALNAAKSAGARYISPPSSAVAILVVPTNEELAIAKQVAGLLG